MRSDSDVLADLRGMLYHYKGGDPLVTEGAQGAIDLIVRLTRERDEALAKCKSGSYSGMNFVTNRDGRIR